MTIVIFRILPKIPNVTDLLLRFIILSDLRKEIIYHVDYERDFYVTTMTSLCSSFGAIVYLV